MNPQVHFLSKSGRSTDTSAVRSKASLRLRANHFVGFLLFVALAVAPKFTFAQLYNYTNASTGAPASTAANTMGTALSRVGVSGANLQCVGATEGFSADGWPASVVSTAQGQYIQFTVTPNSGYQLNLTGFTASLRRQANGPTQVRYAYSLDGFTTVYASSTVLTTTQAACGNVGAVRPWSSMPNVTTTSPVTFRIFAGNASNAARDLTLQNVVLSGSVIPCPALTGIECPDDITVATNTDDCEAFLSSLALPEVTGGCDPDITVSVDYANDGFGSLTQDYPFTTGTFPSGTSVIAFGASEGVANFNCTYTITVADIDGPSITCPADFTVEANDNCRARLCLYEDDRLDPRIEHYGGDLHGHRC
jgi:hypothetical protein